MRELTSIEETIVRLDDVDDRLSALKHELTEKITALKRSFALETAKALSSAEQGGAERNTKLDNLLRRVLALEASTRVHSLKLLESEARIVHRAPPLSSDMLLSSHMFQPGTVEAPAILVVCGGYPSEKDLYRSAFVHRRVLHYKAAGLKTLVFVIENDGKEPEQRTYDGVDVISGDCSYLFALCKYDGPRAIFGHSMPEKAYRAIELAGAKRRLFLFYHGFEVRHYSKLIYNFSVDELQRLARRMEQEYFERAVYTREVFAEREVYKCFNSRYLFNLAKDTMGVMPVNFGIIPNIIDQELFKYEEKSPDLAVKIVSVRSFTRLNYAGDQIVNTILELSRREIFSKLQFHVQGFGGPFQAMTEPLKKFSNVIVREGALTHAEMAQLYRAHGVLLIPTREDSQGVTLGEGMACGLVPVTNRVCAIPEFVDDKSGVLAEGEDVRGLADGIVRIATNPKVFKDLSAAAAQRVRHTCGYDVTIKRELDLIKRLL